MLTLQTEILATLLEILFDVPPTKILATPLYQYGRFVINFINKHCYIAVLQLKFVYEYV